MISGTLFIEINQYLLRINEVEAEVNAGDKKIETTTTSFLSPRTLIN
jgi:hypothetical protein